MIKDFKNNHHIIEQKWQKKWEDSKIFCCKIDSKKKKFYALSMFPYPSGSGLHIGHLASYTPTEIIARFKRAQGFNVLHPMGYDSFGLPAEQYAIQTGVAPEQTTTKAIDSFRKQLKSFGYSFDWDRELSTCSPSYYKWTQFLFKIFFKKKLAYQAKTYVNWCPQLKTVLANEEVIDGKSERGNYPVIRILKNQWLLKITEYCDKLITDLDIIFWPESTKTAQKNWIGKSEGAIVHFDIETCKSHISIFTTRPDTLFAVSYLVIAPEHPLVSKITNPKLKQQVQDYLDIVQSKTEINRKTNKDKTGVWTGAYAKHPITNQNIPIWISDYVLMSYGTGAIMAVPAHDKRDYIFAKKFNLNIVACIKHKELPFEGEGPYINSKYSDINLTGLNRLQACQKIISYLISIKKGHKKTQYKLRDWILSRQRYWGEPFPIVKSKTGEFFTVPDKELPVLLPKVTHYEPSDKGESPLATLKSFCNYKDQGQRETDTMPGSVASSWYFLRYTDPHNDKSPFDFEKQKYWMPVDLYVGGREHSVGHLLYSRFWQKVLFDEGLVSHKEPFKKLVHQGVILGKDGFRMSKSRGNGVQPDRLREMYGADVIRLYICFLGPFDKDKPWSEGGIDGLARFLDRYYRFAQTSLNQNDEYDAELHKSLHKTIKKVTEDLENLSFNTAISSLMILLNACYKHNVKNQQLAMTFSQLLMPFAPHITEEIWEYLGQKSFISLAKWPIYDKNLVQQDKARIGIQINGRVRDSMEIFTNSTQEEALSLALKQKNVKKFLKDQTIKTSIYRSGKILNIII